MTERTTGQDSGDAAAQPGGFPAMSFDLVTARYTGMISRIALAYEADPALRRELVQDIMLAIWGSLPHFRGQAPLKTFVAGIAYKKAISHVARAVRRPKSVPLSDDLPDPNPRPDETASRNQLKAQMLNVIKTLPLAQKQAIILCLEDFTFKEIGETLGISARAAAMRCHRAREALRSAMEKWS